VAAVNSAFVVYNEGNNHSNNYEFGFLSSLTVRVLLSIGNVVILTYFKNHKKMFQDNLKQRKISRNFETKLYYLKTMCCNKPGFISLAKLQHTSQVRNLTPMLTRAKIFLSSKKCENFSKITGASHENCT
jgi:hypothetical protein